MVVGDVLRSNVSVAMPVGAPPEALPQGAHSCCCSVVHFDTCCCAAPPGAGRMKRACWHVPQPGARAALSALAADAFCLLSNKELLAQCVLHGEAEGGSVLLTVWRPSVMIGTHPVCKKQHRGWRLWY